MDFDVYLLMARSTLVIKEMSSTYSSCPPMAHSPVRDGTRTNRSITLQCHEWEHSVGGRLGKAGFSRIMKMSGVNWTKRWGKVMYTEGRVCGKTAMRESRVRLENCSNSVHVEYRGLRG